jgi:hypothetical protein
MNYHSRTPNYSNHAGRVLNVRALVQGGILPADVYAMPGMLETIGGIDGAQGPAGYFFEYPEDIRLYGVSFQTNVAGMSLGGELSYRPNMPMQISTGDMSRTALLASGVPIPGGGGAVISVPGSDNTHRGLEGQLEPGDYIQGYVRKEFWQAQVTFVHFIERVMGASRLSLVGEAGVNYIGGLGNTTKFGRDSLFGQSPYVEGDLVSAPNSFVGSCASNEGTPADERSPKAASWCENDGFHTRWSSGYRLRAALDYSNVFAGVNLSPSITWSHDVDGYGPNFTENAKAISLGLNADYANRYSASLSYTNFFDGKYNTNVDRDFVAASVSVTF